MQTAFSVQRLIVHGQHQRLEVRETDLHVFDQLDTASLAQRNVDDGHMRLQLFHGFQGSMGVAGLAADFQVGFSIDALRQSFAENRMIVHQQHPVLAHVVRRFLGVSGFSSQTQKATRVAATG